MSGEGWVLRAGNSRRICRIIKARTFKLTKRKKERLEDKTKKAQSSFRRKWS